MKFFWNGAAILFQIGGTYAFAADETAIAYFAMLSAIYCGVMLCAVNIDRAKGGA